MATEKKNTFKLGSVVKTNADWKPQRIVISGVHGLGKGTFGATFEKPILIRTEDGAGNLEIDTFPALATTFSDMESAIKELHGEHPFKTCIIDSLDWLEPIIFDKQIKAEPYTEKGKEIKDIEGYGFGKGFTKALQWWRYIMGGLDSLRNNKNMSIVLIAHTEIKRYDPPDSEPYDRYQIKLHKHASALWQEWADVVLFVNYKTTIEKTDVGFNKKKTRGVGKGERVIYTEERPAYLAKNMWGLPAEIYIGQDKTWADFHIAFSECTNGRYEIPNTKNQKE